MAMFLDDAEISDLTRIRHRQKIRRYREQAAALSAMGIHYLVRGDGSLVVSRAHVEKMLGVHNGGRPEPVPNWDAGFDWSLAYAQERERMRMHRKAEQDKIDAARAKRRAVQEAAGLIKKKKSGRPRDEEARDRPRHSLIRRFAKGRLCSFLADDEVIDAIRVPPTAQALRDAGLGACAARH